MYSICSLKRKVDLQHLFFYHLKVTSDQHERKKNTLEVKLFDEVNHDKKHSIILSHMKKKLSVLINAQVFLKIKPNLIILTNPSNEEFDQNHDENKSL